MPRAAFLNDSLSEFFNESGSVAVRGAAQVGPGILRAIRLLAAKVVLEGHRGSAWILLSEWAATGVFRFRWAVYDRRRGRGVK